MEKILFYIGSMYRGGAQRVLSVIMNSLIDQFEVYLVTDVAPNGHRDEYYVDPNIHRIILNEGSNKQSNINKILLLRKTIRKISPCASISFLGQPNLRNILASIGLRTRTIVSVRNDPYKEYGGGIKKFIANLLFLKVDMCVFQTEQAREYFRDLPNKKCSIIPNPVDDSFFSYESNYSSNEIAIVGRLEKQKNPLLALRSFSFIQRDYPKCTLHYYGEGSLRSEIEDQIRKDGLEERVFLHGEVSNTGDYLAKSCLYILCSDYEGMPNALMEAMAVGVPCIATDCPCGGPKFLLGDVNDELLFPVGNTEELVNRIRKVLSDQEFRVDTAKAIKRKAQEFKTDIIVQKWKKLF